VVQTVPKSKPQGFVTCYFSFDRFSKLFRQSTH